MRRRLRAHWSSLLAAALVAASVGVGAWKVVEVRRENARLAVVARACEARNEAFLAMVRAAGLEGARPVPAPAPR